MPVLIDYRSVDGATVYTVAGIASGMGPDQVAPAVHRLLERLTAALAVAGRRAGTPSIVWYEAMEGSDHLRVHVSVTAHGEPEPGKGFDVVQLPPLESAAVLVHRGDVARLGDSWMVLLTGIVDDGFRVIGPTREVHLRSGPDLPSHEWVTELQAPVEPAA